MYHEPCNVDQLLIECDSVGAKLVRRKQMYPIGMSTMQADYEVERAVKR